MAAPTVRRASFSIFILCLSLFSGILFAGKAQALTLSVTPPKFDLFGNPGEILIENLKVRNDSTESATYQIDIQDFTASDDVGNVNFIEDPEAPRTAFSLSSWVTASPKRFSVGAGEEAIVGFTIKIPKDAEPGSHFGSVQARQVVDTPVGGGASVESKLSSLILLRVSGNVTEKAETDYFRTDKQLFQKAPVSFAFRVKNDGNVHVAPSGTITIYNTITRKKVTELPLNSATVLPGSARLSTTTLESIKGVGRFEATLNARYGQGQTPINASVVFYILPTWLIVTGLLLILFIFLVVTQRKRFRKLLHSLTSD